MATNNSNFDILIKRRLTDSPDGAASPTNNTLKNGELAMNEVDQTLYYGMSTGAGQISAIPIGGAGFLGKTTAPVTGTVTGNMEGGTVTTQALTSDIELGGYTAGETISAGTTLAQFITGLLYKEYTPDITEPSGSLTASAGGTVEVGATANVTLTYNFNRGTIMGDMSGSSWNPNKKQADRAGAATSYDFDTGGGSFDVVDDEDGSVIANSIAFGSTTKTFKGRVSYGAGPQPVTSKGANYDSAASPADNALEKTATIAPQRKYFYKVSSSPIASANSSDIRNMTGTFTKPTSLPFAIGDLYAVLALPQGHALTAATGDGGFSVLGNYESKTVSVDGATPGADGENYTVYTFQTNAQPKAISHVYTIS